MGYVADLGKILGSISKPHLGDWGKAQRCPRRKKLGLCFAPAPATPEKNRVIKCPLAAPREFISALYGVACIDADIFANSSNMISGISADTPNAGQSP